MKVTIVRGGGFSGLVSRTELDAQKLGSSAAQTLASEVARAKLDEQPAPAPARRWPDAQSYELCVEDAGSAVHVRYTDATMPEPVRLLLAWVDARPERTDTLE